MPQRKSRSRKSRKSRGKKSIPSTFSLKRRASSSKQKTQHGLNSMSLTDLQNRAMSLGIAFGGLSKTQLRERIERFK